MKNAIDEATLDVKDLSRRLIDRSAYVPIDDIISIVEKYANILPDFCIFILAPKLFQSEQEISHKHPFLVLPYLSFGVASGSIKRFRSAIACYEDYDNYSEFWFKEDFCHIKGMHPALKEYERLVVAIADVCIAMFHFYQYEPMLKRSASTYYYNMINAHEVFNIFDYIKIFVREKSILESNMIMYITISGVVTYFDGEHFSEYGDSAIVDELRHSLQFSLHSRRRSNGSFAASERRKYYAVIPNVSPFDSDIEAGSIVILSSTTHIQQYIVTFIEYAIEKFSMESNSTRQHLIIQAIWRLKAELMGEIRRGLCDTMRRRKEVIRVELEKICHELAIVTSAHSVTVRLYDYKKNALRVYTSFDGAHDLTKGYLYNDISLNNYRNSVNVFTFFTRPVLDPIIIDNLNRFNATNFNAKYGHSTIVFASPLLTRRESKSECCAALRLNNIAIGTINIESQKIHIFGRHRVFIATVAQGISELFTIAYEGISSETANHIAKIHDLAHAAAGHEIERDIKDFNRNLRDRIPASIDAAIQNYISFRNNYRQRTIINGSPSVSFKEFIDGIDEIAKTFIVPKFDKRTFEVKYIQTEGSISSYMAHYITQIITFLFVNSNKHAEGVDLYEIYVGIEQNGVIEDSVTIRFCSGQNYIDSDVVENFGLTPIYKEKKYRLGAFLMGYLVRALGGCLDVSPPVDEPVDSRIEFEIRIPTNSGSLAGR